MSSKVRNPQTVLNGNTAQQNPQSGRTVSQNPGQNTNQPQKKTPGSK